nr:unnamed protein product [Callosobruchus chinensis]
METELKERVAIAGTVLAVYHLKHNFRLCRLEKRSIIGPGQRFPVTWLKKTNNDGEYILSCKGMIQSDKILCEVNLQKIDRFRYRMDSSHRKFVNDEVKYYHEQFLTEQQGECDPTKRNTPGNFTGTISDGYDTNGGKTQNESSPKVITLQNVILKPADTVQGEKEKTSGSDMSQDSGRNHQPSSKESDEWNAKKLVLENESETDTHLGVENKSPEESVFQDSGSEYTPSPKKTKNKNTSKWVSENRKFVIQKKKQKLKSSQTGSKKSGAGDFNDNGYKMFTNESLDKLDASEDHSEDNDLCNAELTTHIQEIGNFDVPDKNKCYSDTLGNNSCEHADYKETRSGENSTVSKRRDRKSRKITSNVTVQVVNFNKDGVRVYDKYHSCFVCNQLFLKMARHLELKHADKLDVAKVLAKPKVLKIVVKDFHT